MARKLKNVENGTQTLFDLDMARNTKNLENEKCPLQDLEYGEKTEKRGKLDTHTVGHGKWRETLKKVKMKNAHCRTWNMAIKLTNKKNDKLKQQDLDYGEKNEKNVENETQTHGRTWKMARNSEKREK